MNTEQFLQHFSPYILNCFLHAPAISIQEGIRFFYPVPAQQQPGCIFLGRNHEWMRLLDDQKLLDGCTYLICTTKAFLTPLPADFDRPLNAIFLNMTIHDALQLLDFIMYGYRNHAQENGERILIDFFRAISAQDISDHETMLLWQQKFPHPLKTFLTAIVVRPKRSELDFNRRTQIHESLIAFFPETNLFHYHGEWIILHSQAELASDQIQISYSDFSALLTRLDLYAGISYVGVIPENFYTLYLTASASIDLGSKINLPFRHKNIYTFAQYHSLYLIHLCAKQYEQIHYKTSFYYMAHPDVVRIYLYDKGHNTDLLDTLYAFLINNSSLAQTAQHSYMHRNTIYNKLSKIESIIGYPISGIKENSVFILSYMVIRYYRDYQRNDIYESGEKSDD